MEIICPAGYSGAEELIEAIPELSDQGVTAIEFGSECFDRGDVSGLESLMGRLSSCGIRVHSIHAPYGASCDPSSPDDEIHERGVDAVIDSIELAGVVGAGTVVVHAGHATTNGTGRCLDRARGVLREVGVIAKESGVVLALENLPPNYLGHTPDEIFELLEGTDSEYVAVCFNSGNANLSGHFDEFAHALLPRSVITHLCDNDGCGDQHRFPGDGTINWRRFTAVYRDSRCKAGIVLECPLPNGLAWSDAFQRLRRALGE